ncbi:hypothetical protein EAL2_808p01900 (plasmid) [Peptoclostridium acidaminophilum DSM 3953]|uniref:SPOR domain-containing protein n=1 Tax=Peptoclostridium acidaminophilum DSM 3953 TaxID=1286171 RepID=W8T9Y1_PEPAC|nr:N-acetylmuramoyl-L-alanine amidase [Peptoclostridium acidaminophilum]AHM57695.1 hypothetical protein EAL2_808p01900 [Peptoclostridium acidaminophilum DSM 3953]
MKIKIYLSPSNQPNNKYCIGNTNEKEQMEDLAKRIKCILDSEYECEVIMAMLSLGIGIEGRASEAKGKKCDVYLAIHSNAGNGKSAGAVAFYNPGSVTSRILATNIVKELNAICPIKTNRGISVASGLEAFNGKGYGEVRNPGNLGMIAVLAETDFHDNPHTAKWIISSKDAIARAYVNALVSTFNISKKKAAATLDGKKEQKLYRVQVGAFSDETNAQAMLKKLKVAGFEGYVKHE